jgi:hypothetical protein
MTQSILKEELERLKVKEHFGEKNTLCFVISAVNTKILREMTEKRMYYLLILLLSESKFPLKGQCQRDF